MKHGLYEFFILFLPFALYLLFSIFLVLMGCVYLIKKINEIGDRVAAMEDWSGDMFVVELKIQSGRS